MNTQKNNFTGFHPQSLGFLNALEFQNDPLFFNANKELFIQHIKNPMYSLCDALAPYINKIDPNLDTRPSRSICRIRRDARFSKGVPYRTNMWLAYKPSDRSNTDYFTYFFAFDSNSYSIGIGFYGIHSKMMQAFRDRISSNPAYFEKVINNTNISKYEVKGDDYKNKYKKMVLPNDIKKWYNKKSFHLIYESSINDTFFSESLVDEIVGIYNDFIPLYDFVLGRDVRGLE